MLCGNGLVSEAEVSVRNGNGREIHKSCQRITCSQNCSYGLRDGRLEESYAARFVAHAGFFAHFTSLQVMRHQKKNDATISSDVHLLLILTCVSMKNS